MKRISSSVKGRLFLFFLISSAGRYFNDAMAYHIYVSGRVQGVGYRRFAQKQAESLKIKGWTRNLVDGRVEVMALGQESILEQFCDALKKGPQFSMVQEVLVKKIDEIVMQDMDLSDGFKIRPDAEWK